MKIKDPQLFPLWDKIQQHQRLTKLDGFTLFESDDLLGLGSMANWVKENKTGQRATFVLNRQINPTNICVLSCRFCDYATKEGNTRAYKMSKEEILSKCNDELREIHIVSGLYRGWSFEE